MLLGFIIAGYSWATTISDIKPIINDWRIGIGIGILIFFLSTLFFILRLFGNFTWSEPEIVLTPKVYDDHSDGSFYQNARLNVYNNEQIEITDCFATLIDASDYIEDDHRTLQDRRASNQRLRWSQSGFSNDKCELAIPPKDSRDINVVHTKRHFEYLACGKPISSNIILGTRLYLVKIRLDGKFNGKTMKPLLFNGYLYYGGELYFEEGDWMKDKRLPIPRPEKEDIKKKKRSLP